MKSRNGRSPTIVLVHGAFTDSASWDGVIHHLADHGCAAVAAVNPLRSLAADAECIANLLDAIEGPTVLVGQAYGGAVISNAARGNERVKALVFVAGFAPEAGESIGDLSSRYPGSMHGGNLTAVALADGPADLWEEFHAYFATDLPSERIDHMASTQRPLRDIVLSEASGTPAWGWLPSWFVFGTRDRVIPAAVHLFMAKRARARAIVELDSASHALTVSHPAAVSDVILDALRHVAAVSTTVVAAPRRQEILTDY